VAASVIEESRSSPGGGSMSVEQIERELGRLRMNEDGTLGLRASVLNLIVVTDEDSAQSVTRSVSNIAGHYPSRAIVLISDPEEGDTNLEFQLSAFCSVRGGSGAQVCAEQITIHAEGPPAEHLESLAGPLLISDLPVFLWYPGPFSPSSPEFTGMVSLADRIIIDSAAAGDRACLREIAGLLEDPEAPAIGDLQWVMLTPWRALVAELFNPPERAEELDKIRRVEVLHTPAGECRALLFVGWLSARLGWRPEGVVSRAEEGREVHFAGPSGEVVLELSPNSPDARFRRVRLYSDEYSFQVSRHRDLSDARTTVMRGEELLGELTVRLGGFDLGVILGEELQYRGRDEVYEAAVRTAVEILDL
jgi:glucose-6-phosphate dehydrogenase assembly protein OpcA